MKELLEAGVHFGHRTNRWNPKMKRYIYGGRNGIYIVDLHQTLKLFEEARAFIQEVATEDKPVLFVGTKKQAQDAVEEAAKKCRQYWVSQRWLGGMLTTTAPSKTASSACAILRRLRKKAGSTSSPRKEPCIFARSARGGTLPGRHQDMPASGAISLWTSRKSASLLLRHATWHPRGSHRGHQLRPG